MSNYTNVKEFMQIMQQDTPPKLCDPGYAVRHLRAKLILEEAFETVRALGFGVIFAAQEIYPRGCEFVELYEFDPVETFDGLLDLDYVGLQGTSIALGISEEQVNAGVAEVHRSNMSKLWTREAYDDKFVVKDKDGKVVKSPSFTPPNLKNILYAETNQQ